MFFQREALDKERYDINSIYLPFEIPAFDARCSRIEHEDEYSSKKIRLKHSKFVI